MHLVFIVNYWQERNHLEHKSDFKDRSLDLKVFPCYITHTHKSISLTAPCPVLFFCQDTLFSTVPVTYRSKNTQEPLLLSRAAQSWRSPAPSGLQKLSTEHQQNLTGRLITTHAWKHCHFHEFGEFCYPHSLLGQRSVICLLIIQCKLEQ